MENKEKHEITESIDEDKIRRVWQRMNDNERLGLKFGLFPAWTLAEELSQEETVRLMKIYEEQTGDSVSDFYFVKGGDRTFGYKMNNKNGSKPMSYKQEYYIKNLLTYRILTENYHGYVGYVLKLLQDKAKMTSNHASHIIDTLKEMIEIEKARENGQSDDSDDNEFEEEIVE